MADSPLPLMLTASGMVTLDALAQGKPTGKPIVAGFLVTFGLVLIAQGAPEAARALALVIFITALLSSGANLAVRAGLAPKVPAL